MSKRERRGVEASEAEVRGAGESGGGGDDAPPVETGLGVGDDVGDDAAAGDVGDVGDVGEVGEVEIDPAAVDEAVKEAAETEGGGGENGPFVFPLETTVLNDAKGTIYIAKFGDDRVGADDPQTGALTPEKVAAELAVWAEPPATVSLAVGSLTPEQVAAELAYWDSEPHDPTKRKRAAAEIYAEALENKRLMIAQLEREVGEALDRKRRVETDAQTQLERIRLLRISAVCQQK